MSLATGTTECFAKMALYTLASIKPKKHSTVFENRQKERQAWERKRRKEQPPKTKALERLK